MGLKADLHLHTREGEGFIAYDARALIDRAARAGFQVLSITKIFLRPFPKLAQCQLMYVLGQVS